MTDVELDAEHSACVRDTSTSLEEASVALERSRRELEEVAYVVAHDLKSPMRAISTLVDWILADQATKLDDEGKSQLELLRQSATRMQRMIEGLLRYARASDEKPAREPIDVDDLIAEIIDELDPRPGIRVQVEPLPEVRFSRPQLRRLFAHLIDNALRHTGPGGTLVRVSGERRGPIVRFSVADDGMGIAPEHHDRIFRLFQTLTVRCAGEAAGLGLPIARKIVESAGGRLSVDSRLGQGATFRFTILDPDGDGPDETAPGTPRFRR